MNGMTNSPFFSIFCFATLHSYRFLEIYFHDLKLYFFSVKRTRGYPWHESPDKNIMWWIKFVRTPMSESWQGSSVSGTCFMYYILLCYSTVNLNINTVECLFALLWHFYDHQNNLSCQILLIKISISDFIDVHSAFKDCSQPHRWCSL